MKTVVMNLAFDGTAYDGVQYQPGRPSVQEEVEKALFRVAGYPCRISMAGRTDAGVHARGMVVHTRVQDDWTVPEHKIRLAMNTKLPRDIRVMGAQLRDDDRFHARFDAIAREYSYTVMRIQDPLRRLYTWQQFLPFDGNILLEAGGIFTGRHDFTGFSKYNRDTSSYLCTVEFCRWEQLSDIEYRFRIKANRFVYGMVRILVGAMMEAARGKVDIEHLRTVLAAANRDHYISLAPAQGLVFEKAHYPDELNVEFH
ncbi:MAG: tRNA pseudouridine(38-40) synthase TruA [Candidatus Kapabacteria bacterium]|nr:tRNA pseudouridine(38-40) synthase TruA [Candidatus Kapabacteria bacterium]